MEFNNNNFMTHHDPFKFMDMRRVPRSSMESTGSRRSIPSCPRMPSDQETSLMHGLFATNQSVCNEFAQELVKLKDESKYQSLFDDSDEDSNDTYNSSYN